MMDKLGVLDVTVSVRLGPPSLTMDISSRDHQSF